MLWLHQTIASNAWKYNYLCKDLRKINASKHTGIAQNHIIKVSSFACCPYCLLLLLQHRQQICDTLFCSWISEIQRSKDALDQLIQELKTSPVVRRKLLVHACIVGLPALKRSCVWIGISSTSRYVTAIRAGVCGQFQTCIWKRRSWWEFGNKTIILNHPSLGFGAASFLVTRLESHCEITCTENRAPLVVGSFSIDMSFTNLVDCKPSMYSLPKKNILLPEWRGN